MTEKELSDTINNYVWGETSDFTLEARDALVKEGIDTEYIDKTIDFACIKLAQFFNGSLLVEEDDD